MRFLSPHSVDYHVYNNSIDDSHHVLSRRSFSIAARAWDVLRSGSLNPANPLLPDEDPETLQLPDFTSVKEHHLIAAARQVQDEYMDNWMALEETLQQQDDSDDLDAEWLAEELHKLEAPTEYMHNVAALYQEMLQLPSWESATHKVAEILHDKPHEESSVILQALKRVSQQDSSTSTTAAAIRHYLNEYTRRGIGHSEESRELQSQLRQVEARFTNQDTRRNTRQQLEDMYWLVSAKNKHAKLLGYKNHVDYSLQDRMADSASDVTALINQVAERFSTVAARSGRLPYSDTREHLTLDGVLGGMFGLARALFGVAIREQENAAAGWHGDVRLFHVSDEATNEHMASFYMDPFFRETKTRAIYFSNVGRGYMYLSGDITAPVWNDMPVPLGFEEALSIVHEFGHVLQFVLASKSPVSTSLMPQDVSEVLPQVCFCCSHQ